MAVEDGGGGLHRLGNIVQVGFCPLGVALLQKQAERVEVVGELVGQPPLGRVGVHQSLSLLLLQRGLKLRVPPLDDLFVEHIHADQMHQHGHGQAQRQQDVHLDGRHRIIRHHQHDVDDDHHTGKERRHQHLQRLESLPLFPPADVMGHHRPHHKVADRQAEDAERHLPDVGGGHFLAPRQQVEHGVLAQQAHHAVDEAGHQLLAPRSAKAEGEHQQIGHVHQNRLQGEEHQVAEDRVAHGRHGQQYDPKIGCPEFAFAEVGAVHHHKGVPLGQADQMAQQEHFRLIHRRTAPSTRGTRPGSRRIRCG